MLRIVSAGSLKEGSLNSRSNELARAGGQKLRASRWLGHCGSQSASVLIHCRGRGRSVEQLAEQQEPRGAARIGDRKAGHRLGSEADAQLTGFLTFGGRRSAGTRLNPFAWTRKRLANCVQQCARTVRLRENPEAESRQHAARLGEQVSTRGPLRPITSSQNPARTCSVAIAENARWQSDASICNRCRHCEQRF